MIKQSIVVIALIYGCTNTTSTTGPVRATEECWSDYETLPGYEIITCIKNLIGSQVITRDTIKVEE